MFVCIADETDISIKGENEVICGKIARFLVDVNPAERPNSLVTWQKVRGRVIEQIDTSREKYRGSYDRQLVINSVCKEDEGEYQAVLSQLSNGMKKTFSNLIFLFPLGGTIFPKGYKKECWLKPPPPPNIMYCFLNCRTAMF